MFGDPRDRVRVGSLTALGDMIFEVLIRDCQLTVVVSYAWCEVSCEVADKLVGGPRHRRDGGDRSGHRQKGEC